MNDSHDSRVFGKRAPQHLLILASGERVRHMQIRPWMAGASLALVGLACVGYLAATAYLVLRDDLIGATMARQARMQYEYEDRIAALRAQVDRVTSRQMLDQQVVEDKVEKLLEQQTALSARHGKLGTLLDRAQQSGLAGPGPDAPSAPAADHAAMNGGVRAIDALLGKSSLAEPGGNELAYVSSGRESAGDRADRLFSSLTLSLKSIEQDQMSKVRSLTQGATETAGHIEDILQRTGIPVDIAQAAAPSGADTAPAEGGPYVAPMNQDQFDLSLQQLDQALNRLETVRSTALRLPFANPAPGREITSTFGNRTDPFLGTLAMHTGVDFKFETGEEVHSTGAGKVTNAGAVGGYGNMVEIDHGNGISTRYGHLSRILVSVGDQVQAGGLIGRAGSTGRSTGPHLHYEVRYMGEPENPMRFLDAGAKLLAYLK